MIFIMATPPSPTRHHALNSPFTRSLHEIIDEVLTRGDDSVAPLLLRTPDAGKAFLWGGVRVGGVSV